MALSAFGDVRSALLRYLADSGINAREFATRVENKIGGSSPKLAEEIRRICDGQQPDDSGILDEIRAVLPSSATTPAPVVPTDFAVSEDQIAEIRRKLLYYMSRKTPGKPIGFPQLPGEIRVKTGIATNYKTLDRFVNEKISPQTKLPYDTNIKTVYACHLFTADMADPDPMAGLGIALANIFTSESSLGGKYEATQEEPYPKDNSVIFLKAAGKHILIEERFFTSDKGYERPKLSHPVIFRGVLVRTLNRQTSIPREEYLAVMTEVTYSLPRTLILSVDDDDRLMNGHGVDRSCLTGKSRSFSIKMRKSDV
ncbi:hypothetical protein [Roseicella sp. DB1501]|uniref:hypothetical protein n=1 Tax=Roseicella sp. DB1501 TaxID=2730925 RepID=UPI0014931B8B|nr:hypothetical protein [Roseicella sp. DB1501]NOG70470.1 hypothetical protein [Roseicella sp. DB1501]